MFDYRSDSLTRRVTERVAEANRQGKISGAEGAAFINAYNAGLKGSSYLSPPGA